MTAYVIENTQVSKRMSRGAVAVLLAASIGLLPIAGCETIQRETGIGRNAQIGAAGGAAFGGIIAAIAGANPAWIAASVVLGGVTGGVIGDRMGRDDAEKHARTNYNAIDKLAQGQTESWSNKKTGNYGSTTVTRVTTNADGVVCKSYREAVHTSAESVTKGRASPDASLRSVGRPSRAARFLFRFAA
jgi:surface antigen